jgi:hypothetical protein
VFTPEQVEQLAANLWKTNADARRASRSGSRSAPWWMLCCWGLLLAESGGCGEERDFFEHDNISCSFKDAAARAGDETRSCGLCCRTAALSAALAGGIVDRGLAADAVVVRDCALALGVLDFYASFTDPLRTLLS